jgi:hypothetical protein
MLVNITYSSDSDSSIKGEESKVIEKEDSDSEDSDSDSDSDKEKEEEGDEEKEEKEEEKEKKEMIIYNEEIKSMVIYNSNKRNIKDIIPTSITPNSLEYVLFINCKYMKRWSNYSKFNNLSSVYMNDKCRKPNKKLLDNLKWLAKNCCQTKNKAFMMWLENYKNDKSEPFIKLLKNFQKPINIGSHSFSHCLKLRNIYMPDSVASFGTGCLCYCPELKIMILPIGTISIGDECLSNCEALEEIVIPENLQSIGEKCFYNCPLLKRVTIKTKTLNLFKDKNLFGGTTDTKKIKLYLSSKAWKKLLKEISKDDLDSTKTNMFLGFEWFSIEKLLHSTS